MNGGAWLDVDGLRVDVLLRDVDIVERWSDAGLRGEYEVVIEEAHARLCERRTWTLNEKRIVERAGLGDAAKALGRLPTDAPALALWVDAVGSLLDAR